MLKKIIVLEGFSIKYPFDNGLKIKTPQHIKVMDINTLLYIPPPSDSS